MLDLLYFHGYEERGEAKQLETAVLLLFGEIEVHKRLSQVVSFSAKTDFRADSLDPVKQLGTPTEGYLVRLDCEEAVLVHFVVRLCIQEANSDFL